MTLPVGAGELIGDQGTVTRSSRTRSEALMGGHTTLSILGGPPDLLDEAFALAHRCESLWSRFVSTSDVMRLNHAEGAPVEVNELTVRLVRSMTDGFALTGGLFDPTLLPLVMASGYDRSTVDPERLTQLPASATAPGDVDGIRINGQTVRLPLGTTLDAGGIGKGLTADLLCEFALSMGAVGVMAEVSGDIVVAGEAPDGAAWRIGIANPFTESGDSGATNPPYDVVRLMEGAVVTSSIRKRRFTVNGVSTHHLIDPATRRSAHTHIQTVSVIADTGDWAEVLTKPGFLVKPSEYLAWLPSMGAAGMLIDLDGEMHESENWEQYR